MAAGLTWIGPPPAAIRAMGLKDAAKRLMLEPRVGVTPGYLGEDQSLERLAQEAEAIGWPVLIKAVAGGGGKGMRRVERAGRLRGSAGRGQARRRSVLSAMIGFCSRNTLRTPGISRCRFSGIHKATSCTSSSATVHCSAGTRKSSRKPRRQT